MMSAIVEYIMDGKFKIRAYGSGQLSIVSDRVYKSYATIQIFNTLQLFSRILRLNSF